jgi:hypothetical protein
MATETAGTKCVYRRLENGIHQFEFQESSKPAIDEFFGRLERILIETPHTETNRYLIDVTGGDREVSIVSMSQRFRRLEAQFPHRARGRSAILHKPNVIISFFDNFIRALAPTGDITRFFTVDQRDEAIRWLLSNER